MIVRQKLDGKTWVYVVDPRMRQFCLTVVDQLACV